MSEFEFVADMQLRMRDIDQMGHVNNAVYITYLEVARDEYVKSVVGESLLDCGAVIANLDIDFLAPIGRGTDVTVAARVRELGTSSIRMDYEIRGDGETAATAETTIITFDREAEETKPLPDDWRTAIENFEGL